MSGRWTAVGAVVALLVTATPLVEFTSRAVADEEQAVVENPSGKVEGEEFVWRFSNGLEVEFIGLAKNPSQGAPWWRPDGKPLNDVSLPAARYRSDSESWELAYRWRNVPGDHDQTRDWHTLPHYGGAGGGVTKKEPGGSILEVVGVSFDGDPKEIAVTFTASVSATPWKTLSSSDVKHASSAGVLVNGRHRGMAFAPAHETEAGTAITVTFGLEGDSGRVIAVDKLGKEHVASQVTQVGSMGFMQGTFTFDKLSKDEIERFELQMQSRKFETVEFRNVSLEAGHVTKQFMAPPDAVQKKMGARPPTPATDESTSPPGGNEVEASNAGVEAMSVEEALKIVRPETATRYEAPSAEERRAHDRIALEHRKLFQELVDNGTFALKPGELVKFVPASESGEVRRRLASLTEVTRRVFLFVKVTKDGKAEVTSWTMDDLCVMDAIDSVLGLPIQEVDGQDQTLAQELPDGDWVCSWDPREQPPLDQQLVAAFEKTLNGTLKESIKLSLVKKNVPVLVASGAYQANPIIDEHQSIPVLSPEVAKSADGPFCFPARRGATAGKVTNFHGVLDMVGGLLLAPIVSEASPGPTKESYFMSFAKAPKVNLHEPLDAALKQAIIEAFEKQTGLTLTPDEREVQVLKVSGGVTE